MTKFDLIVLGDCNPDLVLSGNTLPTFSEVEQLVETATLTIGGSGSIVAAGAARLGLAVAVVAVVGDDALGRVQLEALAERCVDVSHVIVDPAARTGVTVVLWNGNDRAILTAPGTTNALRVELIDREIIGATRHVHIASYFLQDCLRPGLPNLLAELRARGVTTSLDTNWDPSGAWQGGLDEVLDMVDCFLPNVAEALHITGASDADAAADMLARRISCIAVKLGAEGAIARLDGKTAHSGVPMVDVVDTIGAGDSFVAGFLAGRLTGRTLPETLSLACTCGSLSTRAAGGVTAQPTLEEALETMSTFC